MRTFPAPMRAPLGSRRCRMRATSWISQPVGSHTLNLHSTEFRHVETSPARTALPSTPLQIDLAVRPRFLHSPDRQNEDRLPWRIGHGHPVSPNGSLSG